MTNETRITDAKITPHSPDGVARAERSDGRANCESRPSLRSGRATQDCETIFAPERITDELHDEPFRFGFFTALRQLDAAFRNHPRTGSAARPSEEPVRLGQEPSLSFNPATLSSFEYNGESGKWRLLSYFLGLFGPNGALPLHLTEYAHDRSHNQRDETFNRFADMFHHRFLSFFYRAWASGQPTVQFDRPELDRFADYVGSLFGIGMDSLQDRDAMPDLAKNHFAGHLSNQTRHADGLADMLTEFFRLPVRVDEFVARWIELPRDCRLFLGRSTATGQLGVSTTIGSRVWDRHQSFRINLGPVGLKDYVRMLPGRESLRRLIAVVRNYTSDAYFWDLQLTLKQEEVPQFQLGQMGDLGWTTWLTSKVPKQDADDLVLYCTDA